MLCSVAKHLGSGRERKKCRGKHKTMSSVFPYFLSDIKSVSSSCFHAFSDAEGSHSGESAHLQSIWPEYNSAHTWVEFVVGSSLVLAPRVFLRVLRFS